MKHSLKWNRNKTTRNNFLTYGVVILVYIIIQIMIGADSISSTMEGLLVPICAYVVMALSLNLTVGVLGELSLGHAGFMSVGAFTGVTAAVALGRNVSSGPVLLIVGMVVGALFAALVGFLIGIPVLRLKGDYLAIVTLAFGEIIKGIFNNLYVGVDRSGLHVSLLSDTTNLAEDGDLVIGGPMGLSGIPRESTFTAGVILIILSLIVIFHLVNSRSGRAIMAVRDNRIAAESIGINVTKYKLMAFTVSAAPGRRGGHPLRHELHHPGGQQVRLQHLHPHPGLRGPGRPGEHAGLHHRRCGSDHPPRGPAGVLRLPDAGVRHRADPGDAGHQQRYLQGLPGPAEAGGQEEKGGRLTWQNWLRSLPRA